MTTQLIEERLLQALGEKVSIELADSDTLIAKVDSAHLVEVMQYLRDHMNARFMYSVGADMREQNGCFAVNQVMALDGDKAFLVFRTDVDPSDATIPSLTSLIPAASWNEREVNDLIGVRPLGHPDPRRLVLPDDFPDDIYPLRRDFHYDEHPPQVERKSELKTPPEGARLFPIGPFYPTLEEPVFINLFVEGEHIVGMDYRGFYAHRGIEKLGDSELTYQQVPAIAERICGICGFVHSSTYCQTVEKAAGIEIPDRARYIRTILLELERVHSHLLWIGLACHFIGFDTLFMQAWRMREPVMWLAEYITGNRKTYGINKIGGLTRDLPSDAKERILPVIDSIEEEVGRVVDAILQDGSLAARLQGAGILTPEDARGYCVVGPTARGSGLDIDARRDHPFAAYADLDFEVCVEKGCDNWARAMVRIRELSESIKLLRQALDKLPAGDIAAEIHSIAPYNVGVSAVEAPRGEVSHYVMTGNGQRPHRWRVRAPSYNNLQSIPALLRGMTIADAPISVGSLDPCFSCTERMGVVDQRTGIMRIYTRDELLKLSQEKG